MAAELEASSGADSGPGFALGDCREWTVFSWEQRKKDCRGDKGVARGSFPSHPRKSRSLGIAAKNAVHLQPRRMCELSSPIFTEEKLRHSEIKNR